MTPVQERKLENFVSCIMACRTIAEAAVMAGINKRTALRWMKLPEYQQLYRKAKQDLARKVREQLLSHASEMIGVLVEIAGDQEAPAHARVQAASKELQRHQDAEVLESLNERITRLEEQTKG